MQNTMARGGGEMVPGKKMKNEAVGNKMKKGERKKKKRKKCLPPPSYMNFIHVINYRI